MRGVTFFIAAETAACLRVRHAICNYLVVVFLCDRPSAYSMQCTCWSGAEVRGSAPYSRLLSLGAVCNDIVLVFTRVYDTLVWRTKQEHRHSCPIQNCLGTDREIAKTVNKHRGGLIRYVYVYCANQQCSLSCSRSLTQKWALKHAQWDQCAFEIIFT